MAFLIHSEPEPHLQTNAASPPEQPAGINTGSSTIGVGIPRCIISLWNVGPDEIFPTSCSPQTVLLSTTLTGNSTHRDRGRRRSLHLVTMAEKHFDQEQGRRGSARQGSTTDRKNSFTFGAEALEDETTIDQIHGLVEEGAVKLDSARFGCQSLTFANCRSCARDQLANDVMAEGRMAAVRRAGLLGDHGAVVVVIRPGLGSR